MSSMNESHHALIKTGMSLIGVWPGQSLYTKVIRLLSMFMTISFIVPLLVRLYNVSNDSDTAIIVISQLITGLIIAGGRWSNMLKRYTMNVMIETMERHWKVIKNTPAISIFEEYARHGAHFVVLFAIFNNITLILYLAIPTLPVILDFVNPLNETRPRNYIYEAEYGVDREKYYWFILAHGYLVSIITINMMVVIETLYILFVEHACALFEVVGFNLKLAMNKYGANEENAVSICYQKVCDCIIVHEEAIGLVKYDGHVFVEILERYITAEKRPDKGQILNCLILFAGMIESVYTGAFVFIICGITILISMTAVQALINVEHPEVVIRLLSFTTCQVFFLYCNTISGQRLIDHSTKVHKFAYDLDWYNLTVKTQKLLILILIRSNKPCFLTAGKIYVVSMENFGSVIQTAVSYFMVLVQLL